MRVELLLLQEVGGGIRWLFEFGLQFSLQVEGEVLLLVRWRWILSQGLGEGGFGLRQRVLQVEGEMLVQRWMMCLGLGLIEM